MVLVTRDKNHYRSSKGYRGASCSGKTTLAKHLKAILPDSIIIHQDVSVYNNICTIGHLLIDLGFCTRMYLNTYFARLGKFILFI